MLVSHQTVASTDTIFVNQIRICTKGDYTEILELATWGTGWYLDLEDCHRLSYSRVMLVHIFGEIQSEWTMNWDVEQCRCEVQSSNFI